MSTNHFPQTTQLDACIQHHDLPITNAHLATIYAEYADSQEWASLMNHQNVTIPVADQLTTATWAPHVKKVQHVVLRRINICSRCRFVFDVSTSITIHGLTLYLTNYHVG